MNVSPDSVPGYRSAAYAAALSGLGRPVPLGDTGGFLIERTIPGTPYRDLMGPYPLFCCGNWDALEPAIATLGAAYVTLTLVTDPFCPLPPERLAGLFPHVRPLHDHYLIDLAAPPVLSRHHRRKLRQSDPAIRIEAAPADAGDLAAWTRLYSVLIARKGITDLRRFDEDSFRHQLSVPGTHIVTAWDGPELLGADIYYLDGDVAWAHLSAYAEAGYARSVSYPMMAHAIDHFRPLARWIGLGGAPAVSAADTGGGIAHFKGGWTPVTRPSHLCGLILDPAAYAALCPDDDAGDYFPAYRRLDFRRSA